MGDSVTEECCVESVALLSGLSMETCRELLKKGWTYQLRENAPPVWLPAVVRLKKEN